MSSTFFQRQSSAAGDRIRIHDQEWTTEQCIQILQYIVTMADALNFERSMQARMLKYANNSPTGAEEISKRVRPLMNKIIFFFSLLISVEDGGLQQQVDFRQVDDALLKIAEEVKRLFSVYQTIIWLTKSNLITFFQSQLQNPILRDEVKTLFTTHDIRNFFCHMMNQKAAMALQAPTSETQSESFDPKTLNEVIKNINALQSTRIMSGHLQRRVSRDLAYLRELQQGSFYDNDQQQVALSALSIPELNHMVSHRVSLPKSEASARVTLQLLAIVSEIYHRTTQHLPSDAEKRVVLLVLEQPKLGLHWSLEAHTPTTVLLLYIAILCLRGDTVYLEHPQQRLTVGQNLESSRKFLLNLQLSYEEIQASQQPFKTGIITSSIRSLERDTYYFGFLAAPELSGAHTLDSYLTQALNDIKQLILKPFDAWYAILVHQDPAVLQTYRQTLFDTINTAWVEHIMASMPLNTLQQVDEVIALFQTQQLPKIWQNIEMQLIELSCEKSLREEDRILVSFLREQSDWIQASLRSRSHPQYGSVLSDIHGDMDPNDAVNARLYYDQACLSQDEKARLIQQYIKNQLQVLHHLCPKVRRSASYTEQIDLYIDYLDDQVRLGSSVSLIQATQLCVELYTCIQTLLPYATPRSSKMSRLMEISKHTAIKSMSQTLLTRLHWVKQTNNFYVRWLERREVTVAAQQIHRMAQKVFDHPNDAIACKRLLQTLYEQHTILSQLGWYFPFGWFFGYPDTRDVLATAIRELDEGVVLGQIPASYVQEAKEAAACAPLRAAFEVRVQQCRIDPQQAAEWQQVLSQIRKIQSSDSGFGMMYELRYYLLTQRQKFMSTCPSYFYGPRQVDHVEDLLGYLNDVLQKTKIPHTERLFLSKKEQLLAKSLSMPVAIQKRHLGRDYFDVWIKSEHPCSDLQPLSPQMSGREWRHKLQTFNGQKSSKETSTPRKSFGILDRLSPVTSNNVAREAGVSFVEDTQQRTIFKRFYSTSSFFAFVRDREESRHEVTDSITVTP